MDSNNIISVKNLSKIYKLYDQPINRLKETLFYNSKTYHKEFYALNNVSFDVKKGEIVGIIGENGSGKSTLLKMITGVLSPSIGQIEKKGKVSALLELGAGFKEEYTGLENIYFNGVLMGYTKAEIENKIPQILKFADIGEFINYPVKTYSSGMFVRLAFSVAINVEPDILIVDEALAVGDDLFQRKCYAKFEELKKKGVTILFVSHSGQTIVELCTKVILIDKGEKLIEGTDCNAIVNAYHKLLYASEAKKEDIRNMIKSGDLMVKKVDNDSNEVNIKTSREFFDESLVKKDEIAYENKGAVIESCNIINAEGERVNILHKNKQYIWEYTVKFEKKFEGINFGMLIKTITGYELGGATAYPYGQELAIVNKNTRYKVKFKFTTNLNAGTYFLNCGVMAYLDDNITYLNRKIDTYGFRVLDDEKKYKTAIVDFNIMPLIEESV